MELNPFCGRVRPAKHTPRGPFHVLESRHGLAEIVERGVGVIHYETLREANNYAWSLGGLNRFKEVKTLMRKTLPAARRVLGKNDILMIRMRWVYAIALHMDDGATLDDLREAVTTLDEIVRIARRVLGKSHPCPGTIEAVLRDARAALRARETPPSQSA